MIKNTYEQNKYYITQYNTIDFLIKNSKRIIGISGTPYHVDFNIFNN